MIERSRFVAFIRRSSRPGSSPYRLGLDDWLGRGGPARGGTGMDGVEESGSGVFVTGPGAFVGPSALAAGSGRVAAESGAFAPWSGAFAAASGAAFSVRHAALIRNCSLSPALVTGAVNSTLISEGEFSRSGMSWFAADA